MQQKPDDTSLPRDHLNIRESQYEQCPPPTHPNFFELYDERLVQLKSNNTSLPRDHLNIRESQYKQCPPPTHPNFFELYDKINYISQGNMLTPQPADESTSLVRPTTSNCASLPQNQSHNLGGQHAPLDPADRLIFGHFESPQDCSNTTAYVNARAQLSPQVQPYPN